MTTLDNFVDDADAKKTTHCFNLSLNLKTLSTFS